MIPRDFLEEAPQLSLTIGNRLNEEKRALTMLEGTYMYIYVASSGFGRMNAAQFPVVGLIFVSAIGGKATLQED